MSSARTPGGSTTGRLPGGHEVHLKGTLPGRGSRGSWAAIDRQIHGVLTDRDGGWRDGLGGDRRGRSSRTLPECGSVVLAAVTAMGGRGQATGWDRLIVSAPGARAILASVSHACMIKRTNRAHGGGGRPLLMGVSVSPTVCTLGGSGGGEGKFDLGFCEWMTTPAVRAETFWGSTVITTEVACLVSLESRLGLMYLAERIGVPLSLPISCLRYGKSSSSS